MEIQHTKLAGCFIILPKVIRDDRGYFMESYNQSAFDKAAGIPVHFVQDNQSFSTRGVLRGLHYQTGEFAQAKLVRVLTGTVIDIAVDIRPESPTYGDYVAVELSAENQSQLFIPRGFAHGFVVISETATFFYKCDNFYNRESEGGIIYNDPTLNIDWQIDLKDVIISPKDEILPTFEQAKKVW